MVKKVMIRHEKTRERELWIDGEFLSEADMKEANYTPSPVCMHTCVHEVQGYRMV